MNNHKIHGTSVLWHNHNLSYINKQYKSKNCGLFKIISLGNKIRQNKGKSIHQLFNIHFLKTGFIKKDVRLDCILVGNVKDPYFPCVLGIGFFGILSQKHEKHISISGIWRNMLNRCYCKTNKSYKDYGGKGICVSKEWFNFSVFYKDIQNLKNWDKKLKNWSLYSLDKDLSGKNYYSKDTCLWLDKKNQSLYHSQRYTFEAISPTGKIYNSVNVKEFSNKYKLNYQNVCNVINNRQKTHKGWSFRRLEYIKKRDTNET